MKLCNLKDLQVRQPAPAPTAVPTGLLLMGLLLMTFEFPLTVLFGFVLALWGATNLAIRARKFFCCLRHRKEMLDRGQNPGSCVTA